MNTRTPRRSLARHGLRLGALACAGSLVALSAAPASAATVAEASATALRLTVAGTPTDSGSYTVTNDDGTESSTGSNQPALSAVTGQSFVQAGTLAQDADTEIRNRNGFSAACAGLAGDGATLLDAGDGQGCLVPAQNLTLNAANLDLSNLQVIESELLAGLDQALADALAPVLDQLLPALSDALQQVVGGLDVGVFLDLGAIQSQCTAGPGTAEGAAQLVDTAAYAEVMGTRVDLLALPVNPDPNTKVVTGLGEVVQVVLDALRTEFETAIDGALAPLGALVDGAEVLAGAIDMIAEQLAPLEENVLDGTLNKQESPAADEITVTALDLSVLPVSADFGVELLSVQIGESACGPSGRIGTTPTPTPTPTPTTPVPTSVPAGVESAEAAGAGEEQPFGELALLGLLALSAGAGAAAYRRSLRA